MPTDEVTAADVLALMQTVLDHAGFSDLCVHYQVPAMMLAAARTAKTADVTLEQAQKSLAEAWLIGELEDSGAAARMSTEEAVGRLRAFCEMTLPPEHGEDA